jgi:addiction module RelE/StbE family toxin
MYIDYHKNFKKSLKKQTKSVQEKFFEKLDIFIENQFHYSLNNHALKGDLADFRSFDVTGDVRVHYKEVSYGIILVNIGTHSQLYK